MEARKATLILQFGNTSISSCLKALYFSARRGLPRQEKNGSCRPYLSSKLTGFHNQFRLICNAHAPLGLQLGISEPTVIITQTGSVSCVALD